MAVLLAVLFIAAGTLHFVHPDTYARIIPPSLPYPMALVYISGWRRSWAGWRSWSPHCVPGRASG